jgi:hypothetical protein
MTVQDLIAKLQNFPPDMLVRFTAVHGEIDTQVPCIEVGESGYHPHELVLFIDVDEGCD